MIKDGRSTKLNRDGRVAHSWPIRSCQGVLDRGAQLGALLPLGTQRRVHELPSNRRSERWNRLVMRTTSNPPPKLKEPLSATAVYQPSELPQRPTGFKESGESSPPVLRPKREAKSAAAIVYVSADECAGSLWAVRSNLSAESSAETLWSPAALHAASASATIGCQSSGCARRFRLPSSAAL